MDTPIFLHICDNIFDFETSRTNYTSRNKDKKSIKTIMIQKIISKSTILDGLIFQNFQDHFISLDLLFVMISDKMAVTSYLSGKLMFIIRHRATL